MKVSLLIKNGRILDPSRNVDCIGDVAICRGRFVEIPAGEPVEAVQEIDATGKVVCPGFIDTHSHLNYKGGMSAVPADVAMLQCGVTTAIDQGSCGIANYRALLDLLNNAIIQTRMYLHVCAPGLVCVPYKPEPYLPEKWDVEDFKEAFDRGNGRIIGLKARISKNAVLETGIKVLYEAERLSQELNTSLCVHVLDPDCSQSEVADTLKAGDIYCHMYHGSGNTIYENGRVAPAIIEARDRGVFFDSAHGFGNFSSAVAKRAIADGFLPDVIGSDETQRSWLGKAFNLPYLLSWHMACGMTLEEVIRCATANGAKVLHMEGETGTLRPGAIADLAVINVADCSYAFKDCLGDVTIGNKMIIPEVVVRRGELMYRSLASII